jgi:hypothetical protein
MFELAKLCENTGHGFRLCLRVISFVDMVIPIL